MTTSIDRAVAELPDLHAERCHCEQSVDCDEKQATWLRTTLTQIAEEARKEEREQIIKKVEDTIAEFGDQGMECVAGILQESFHGQREVEY